MKTLVLYSTNSGNTEKVADAIASSLNAQIFKITAQSLAETIDLVNYDLVFIGSGVRAGNPFSHLVSYLNNIDIKIPKTFAIFLTWGGAGKTNEVVCSKLKRILEKKNQRVLTNSFCCFGKWNMKRSSHPNNKEIDAAKIWAKSLVEDALNKR